MRFAADVRKLRSLGAKVLSNRRAIAEVRRRTSERPPLPPGQAKIAVYFADGAVNLYQMRQWYKPLEELSRRWPVMVLARAAGGAAGILRESGLPVAYVPSVRQLESVVAEQDFRVVLYVNQNTRNFQMFRYGHRWHVFINHGESDKMYMTTNQFKAYDYAFVAGDAARARLGRVLWDYDVDARTFEIGRPQADHYSGTPPYRADDRTVVLYAPTWEGDRPSAHYGSIRSHGESLVAALLATGRHRVIYRPHPRSGVVDAEYGEANRRIIASLASANAADPTAQHVYDDGPELGWQLASADVAIVDVSAMVYDRLAADRPLLVTRPLDPRAVIDEHGYLSACEWLTAADAEGIVGHVDRLRSDPDAVSRLAHWVRHYFGDTSSGAPTARFHAAVAELMDRWELWHERAGEDDPASEPEDDDAGDED